MDDRPETGLALHDDVWHTHLAAQGGEEDDELDGVNIVCDDNEGGLLGFDEGDDVVETVLDEEGLLGVLDDARLLETDQSSKMTYVYLLAFTLLSTLGSLDQALTLLDLGLGPVLVQELEQLGGGVLVQGVGELSDGRGDLETLVEDDLLALKENVFGPFDETGQVSLGADVLT